MIALHTLQVAVFAAAGSASLATLTSAIMPQWRRIVQLALGNVEASIAPTGVVAK